MGHSFIPPPLCLSLPYSTPHRNPSLMVSPPSPSSRATPPPCFLLSPPSAILNPFDRRPTKTTQLHPRAVVRLAYAKYTTPANAPPITPPSRPHFLVGPFSFSSRSIYRPLPPLGSTGLAPPDAESNPDRRQPCASPVQATTCAWPPSQPSLAPVIARLHLPLPISLRCSRAPPGDD